jgi:hypothetical protein
MFAMLFAMVRWRRAKPSKALASAAEVTDSSTTILPELIFSGRSVAVASSDPCSISGYRHWSVAR